MGSLVSLQSSEVIPIIPTFMTLIVRKRVCVLAVTTLRLISNIPFAIAKVTTFCQLASVEWTTWRIIPLSK